MLIEPIDSIYQYNMSSNLTYTRLQKEENKLLKDPIKNAIVRRKGTYDFHFLLHGLDGDYSGGYYHGALELPTDYPFSPPKLKFFTPSGRFEVNTNICTTFTNFHKETWSTAWNVETMVIGTLSFMQSEEGALGTRSDGPAERRRLAKQSLAFNLNNPVFVNMFGQEPLLS